MNIIITMILCTIAVHPLVLSLGLSQVVPLFVQGAGIKRVKRTHIVHRSHVLKLIICHGYFTQRNVDIDTTGFGPEDHDICRIVAFDNAIGYSGTHSDFSVFVMPNRRFSPEASRLNKFTMSEGQLLFEGIPVKVLSQEDALQRFYDYISGGESLLVSYNSKKFLAPFLIQKFEEYLKIHPSQLSGIRFADPYLMINKRREEFVPCKMENLKLPTVHKYFFPDREPYSTPNAENDSKALREVMSKLNITDEVLVENSFAATDV